MKNSMLIITGDLQLFEQLYTFFQAHYRIELAQDELSCVTKIYQLKPDVLILSYEQPRLHGLEISTQIRPITSAPVLMVGNIPSQEERLRCFEAGADDVLQAPIDSLELYYRINVLLKRRIENTDIAEESDILVFGNLVMNRPLHTVHIEGEEVALTRKEFSLLWVLVQNQNKVVRRNDLVRVIWGYDYIGDDRMVDTHLNRLRKKLHNNHSDIVITTIWGLGYKIERSERRQAINK